MRIFSPDWVCAFHDFSQSLLSEPILCNLSIYSAMVSQLLIHWIRNIKKRSVQKNVNLVDFTILWNKRWSSSLTEIYKILKLFTITLFLECVFFSPFFHFSLHTCQLNGAHHATILKTCLNEEPMPMLSQFSQSESRINSRTDVGHSILFFHSFDACKKTLMPTLSFFRFYISAGTKFERPQTPFIGLFKE